MIVVKECKINIGTVEAPHYVHGICIETHLYEELKPRITLIDIAGNIRYSLVHDYTIEQDAKKAIFLDLENMNSFNFNVCYVLDHDNNKIYELNITNDEAINIKDTLKSYGINSNNASVLISKKYLNVEHIKRKTNE